jgi:hypothetical protein
MTYPSCKVLLYFSSCDNSQSFGGKNIKKAKRKRGKMLKKEERGKKMRKGERK